MRKRLGLPQRAALACVAGLLAGVALGLTGCGGSPTRGDTKATIPHVSATSSARGGEVALYALSLLETGYRFGGKNPSAGLDCSGMVSYVYRQALGVALQGSAADMARRGRGVTQQALRPGDLVFFNTRRQPFSHVGIYIGDARFVHAPSSGGQVRIDSLSAPYYAQRFEAARTYFD